MQPTARKDVIEAVLIATLSALGTALAKWAVDAAKEHVTETKKQRQEAAAAQTIAASRRAPKPAATPAPPPELEQ